MRRSVFSHHLAALALSGVATTSVWAANGYQLTVIADSRYDLPAGWILGDPWVTLNDAGMVAFGAWQGQAVSTDYYTAILIGDGVVHNTIAQGLRPKNSFGPMLQNAAINNRGQVAFIAQDGRAGGTATMLWEAGRIQLFIDSTLNPPPGRTIGPAAPKGLADNTSIVAGSTNSAFVTASWNGTAVMTSGQMLAGRPAPSDTSISRSGMFAAGSAATAYDIQQSAIAFGITVLEQHGVRSYTLATKSGNSWLGAQPSAVNVNNHGLLSFIANGNASEGNFLGLLDGSRPGSMPRHLVDLGTSFSQIGNSNRGAALNNLNELAFIGRSVTGPQTFESIYVTDSAGRTPVRVADLGETVTSDGATFMGIVSGTLNTHGMNDKGQIAFLARLSSDGGQTSFNAILRADPLNGLSPGNPVLPVAGPPPAGGGFVIRPGLGGCTPGFRRQMCWIDPEVAVGYDYSMSAGGPNFAAVQVPAPLANGDEWFELEFGGHHVQLHAGERYDFTTLQPSGVSSFRLTGIDVGEALDPTNPSAFVAGLLFTEGGAEDFAVTMKPLVVNVPEPDTSALMLSGTLLLSLALRRRRA